MGVAERFDVVVIGGGQAGIPLAHAQAKRGQSVALVERSKLGGSCVNFGCTPTKAAIASARVAHVARTAAAYGVHTGDVRVDFAAVIRRARTIAEESRANLERRFQDGSNPRLIRGHGRLDGRSPEGIAVVVGDRRLVAANVVLDTGTRTQFPDLQGLDRAAAIHSGNWLGHDQLPEHLITIGGGVVGIEMAQFYRRMGSRVTVIARSGILPSEDPDVADAIRGFLERDGIAFRLGTAPERIEHAGDGVRVRVDGVNDAIEGTHLLIGTGRKPNTEDLGLDTVGLTPERNGTLAVDERLATSVPGVWVAGDIRGGPQFTHTAWDDYRILESQLSGDGHRTTRRVVPYAVFTDPELGRVGMSETQARRAGLATKVARFDMSKNGKAHELGETDGFIKVVAGPDDRIVGAAVLAVDGAEMVNAYVALMNAGAQYSALRDAVVIHPTLGEAIQSAVAKLDRPAASVS